MADFPLPKTSPINALTELTCSLIPNCPENDVRSYYSSEVRSGAERFSATRSPKEDPLEAERIDFFGPTDGDNDTQPFFANKPGPTEKTVSTYNAFSFIQKKKYGHSIGSKDIGYYVFGTMQNFFFNGSPLDGAHATFDPLVVRIAAFSDSDTAKTSHALIDGKWQAMKLKLRLNLVDGPESYVGQRDKNKKVIQKNPKLEQFENYIWLLWKAKHALGSNGPRIRELANKIVQAGGNGKELGKLWDQIKREQIPEDLLLTQMIENRIVYVGVLSGYISKGIADWANAHELPFHIAPSYNHASLDPALCGSLEYSDVYNRNLGGLYIGLPGAAENYGALFIEKILPTIMAKEGDEAYDFYRNNKKPHNADKLDWTNDIVAAFSPSGQRFLEGLKSVLEKNPQLTEIYNALAPETLLRPSEIYSSERCKFIADKYRAWFDDHPKMRGYKNNLQLVLDFVAAAYVYTKYRNQDTSLALVFEQDILRSADDGEKNRRGLTDDIIYGLGRPDPKNSELFKIFGKALSRGKPLTPEDCCEVLLRTGTDIYGHCSAD